MPAFADIHWMRRALIRARPWRGRCWPNPTVAACLVRDGQLLGEAVHEGAGLPHAEVGAMVDALARGNAPAGATLFVTLEPCNHDGRTPPCTVAIRDAGIRRVVFGARDHNPAVAGGGAEALRDAGVAVVGDFLGELASELNHPFFESDGAARAHVTLKLAVDREGRIARHSGRVEDPAERAVTGPLAHRRAHRIRQGASCVVVGRGTVEADHPRLDVRYVSGGPQPRPVVLDSAARSSPSALPQNSLILHGEAADERALSRLHAGGHETAIPPGGPQSWPGVLELLQDRGLGIVLVEGGAKVAQSLLRSGLVDRFHLFLADRILGGDGPRLGDLAGLLPEQRDPISVGGQRWETKRRRRLGPDWEWVLRPARDGA